MRKLFRTFFPTDEQERQEIMESSINSCLKLLISELSTEDSLEVKRAVDNRYRDMMIEKLEKITREKIEIEKFLKQ